MVMNLLDPWNGEFLGRFHICVWLQADSEPWRKTGGMLMLECYMNIFELTYAIKFQYTYVCACTVSFTKHTRYMQLDQHAHK